MAIAAALALAACRGDARAPATQQPQQPAKTAPGRLEVTMELPQQPGWNAGDTIVVTIANHSQAPVPADAELSLLIQAPVEAQLDTATPGPRPATVKKNQAATLLKFPVGAIAVGETVNIYQPIRTPPAPAPAQATPPGQPRRAPAARADTTTRFLVRAELARPDGSLVAAPAEDTLRIRAGSAVVVGGCGNASDVVVTRYGIGPVRVGMPVDALRAACPEARDTTWTSPERTRETGFVALPGGRRVVAVTAGDSVVRILIDQPGLQTAAGAGVGSSVGDLRARFGRMCAGQAEQQVAVWFPNAPGLSFGLDTAATKAWTPAQAAPDSVPDTVKVTSLWVRRGSDDCPARPGEGGR